MTNEIMFEGMELGYNEDEPFNILDINSILI
jgi:hypothetical protein